MFWVKALEYLGIPYQISQKPQRSEVYSDEDVLGQNEEQLEYNVEKVSLMTLHAAKGWSFRLFLSLDVKKICCRWI